MGRFASVRTASTGVVRSWGVSVVAASSCTFSSLPMAVADNQGYQAEATYSARLR